jgi:hypothetical protein
MPKCKINKHLCIPKNIIPFLLFPFSLFFLP